MGRKMEFPENISLSLRAGTKARIAAVLRADEDRATLIRKAIDDEVERRRQRAAKPQASTT